MATSKSITGWRSFVDCYLRGPATTSDIAVMLASVGVGVLVMAIVLITRH